MKISNRSSLLLSTSIAALLLAPGCNKDTASATAVPGAADASAEGDDAAAGAASDEDDAAAWASEDDDSATAVADGEGAEAEASVSEEDE